jgi:hypothetical protein
MIRNGEAVVIKFGPFAGFTARIVSNRSKRVVVRIVLNQDPSVLVELDDDMIAPAQSGRSDGSTHWGSKSREWL